MRAKKAGAAAHEAHLKLTPEQRTERARKAAAKRWEETQKRKEQANGEKFEA